MATLFKRPDSKYWWIIYVENGRTVRESTKISHDDATKPRGEVLEIQRSIEDRLARNRFGLAPRVADTPIEDWHDAFMKWYLMNSSPKPSTVAGIKRKANVFLKWSKAQQLLNLSQVNPGTLVEYFSQRKIADKTRKHEASWWARVWDRAKRSHKVDFRENPWREFIPRKIKSTPRRAFTAAEIAILLEPEGPLWRQFMLRVGFYTGERYSAILHLRVSDVAAGAIRFQRTKEDRDRYVYCPSQLADYLSAFESAGETWLPQEIIDREKDGESTLMVQFFKRLRKQHPGLFRGVSFHSFRHTYASMLANSGVNRAERMEILDHSTESAHARYVHEEASRALIFKEKIENAFSR